MKKFEWNQRKNIWLKRERDISFEEIVFAIENGYLLDEMEHPSKRNQRLLIVYSKDYVHVVPYVKGEGDSIFLKTIIPSRKAYRKYLGGTLK